MKLFRRYYLEFIGLLLYFWVALPWMLSQPSNIITISGFVSLAVVGYLIVAEIYRVFRKYVLDKEDK